MPVGILHCSLCFFRSTEKETLFFLLIFCNEKGQRDFISTLAFIASHEAPSPNGGLFYSTVRKLHQTGEPRGPLPSGGKTPAKPHVPLCPCAAPPRRSGCRALALPDRRAARPVAERRQNPGQPACPSMPLHGSAAQKWVQGFSPARPASRKARCRAAVKPRPTCMSLYAPARLHRAEVGAGL